jgi:hypothetical protein
MKPRIGVLTSGGDCPGLNAVLRAVVLAGVVSYQNYQVRHVPIAEAVNRLKLVPSNGELVHTARDVDISFGD